MKTFLLLSLLSFAFASIIGNHGEILIQGLDRAHTQEYKYVNIDRVDGYKKFADFLLKTDQPNIWNGECVDCGKSTWTKLDIDSKFFNFDNSILCRQIVSSFFSPNRKPSKKLFEQLRSMGSLARLYFAEYILVGAEDEVSTDLIFEILFYELETALFELLIAAKGEGLDATYELLSTKVNAYTFAKYYCKNVVSYDDIEPFVAGLDQLSQTLKAEVLLAAITSHRFKFASALISKFKFDLDYERSGSTILHAVDASVPKLFLVYLLRLDRSILLTDRSGRSFLMAWIEFGLPVAFFKTAFEILAPQKVTELLNLKNSFDCTALTYTLVHKRYDLMILFLRHGASVDIQVPVRIPKDGFSNYLKNISHQVPFADSQIPRPPLDYAVYNRDYKAMTILLKEIEYDFYQVNAFGESVVEVAANTQDQLFISAIQKASGNHYFQ